MDTQGTLVGVRVHPAHIPDREGAEYALRTILLTDTDRLAKILADGAYRGEDLATWIAEVLRVPLEIVGGATGQRGFHLQAWRWIVERTFAWLSRHRRLAKDVERLAQTTELFLAMAMTHLLLKRLDP